jgi:hypothetical protein
VNTFSRHYWLLKSLLNPSYVYIGLLFVNLSVLDRIKYASSGVFQMTKIMHMEMLNITVLMPVERPMVMIAI